MQDNQVFTLFNTFITSICTIGAYIAGSMVSHWSNRSNAEREYKLKKLEELMQSVILQRHHFTHIETVFGNFLRSKASIAECDEVYNIHGVGMWQQDAKSAAIIATLFPELTCKDNCLTKAVKLFDDTKEQMLFELRHNYGSGLLAVNPLQRSELQARAVASVRQIEPYFQGLITAIAIRAKEIRVSKVAECVKEICDDQCCR
jgi:hypothetical protein